jgi:Lrp/AsnC family leucine-responsive transcriptional regulator
VADRVRRLEDAGVIRGYHAALDLTGLGRPLQAIIRAAPDRTVKSALGTILAEMPEVLECHRVTGEDCYVIHAAVRSPQELEAFIERLGEHARTTTCIVLSSPVTHRVLEPAPAAEGPLPAVASRRPVRDLV